MRLIFATLDTAAKIEVSTYLFCAILLILAIAAYIWGKAHKPAQGESTTQTCSPAEQEARELLRQLGEDPATYSDAEIAEVVRRIEISKSIDIDTNLD